MEGWLRWGDVGHETGLADMQTGMSLMTRQGIYMPLLMAVLAETEA